MKHFIFDFDGTIVDNFGLGEKPLQAARPDFIVRQPKNLLKLMEKTESL